MPQDLNSHLNAIIQALGHPGFSANDDPKSLEEFLTVILQQLQSGSGGGGGGGGGGGAPMGTANPLMDGIANPGSVAEYASIAHRHPSDSSKAEASAFNLLKTAHDNLSSEYDTSKLAITTLETSLGKAQSDITGVQNDVAGVVTSVTSVESDITQIQSQITGIQDDVSAVESDISSIQSDISTINTNISNQGTDLSQIESRIDDIDDLIPNQATDSNQLADKDFVNSSISSMAARYLTPTVTGDSAWTSLSQLSAGENGEWFNHGQSVTPTIHDYAIVIDSKTFRYAFDGSQWNLQYIVNDAPLNLAQMEALNSGATSTIIDSIAGMKTDITALQNAQTSDANHINNKNNPHNVTAAQVNAMPKPSGNIPGGVVKFSNGVLSQEDSGTCLTNLGIGQIPSKVTALEVFKASTITNLGILADRFKWVDAQDWHVNIARTPKEYVDLYSLNTNSFGIVREFVASQNKTFLLNVFVGADKFFLVETIRGWSGYSNGILTQTAYLSSEIDGNRDVPLVRFTRCSNSDGSGWLNWFPVSGLIPIPVVWTGTSGLSSVHSSAKAFFNPLTLEVTFVANTLLNLNIIPVAIDLPEVQTYSRIEITAFGRYLNGTAIYYRTNGNATLESSTFPSPNAALIDGSTPSLVLASGDALLNRLQITTKGYQSWYNTMRVTISNV